MDLITDTGKIYARIPEDVLNICRRFSENGHESYIVGGSVRDLMLGKSVSDFDLTTNAVPEKVMSIFKFTVPTGLKHGTVSVFVNKTGYEVTTFRSDGKYIDGRRPESVEFAKTLEEDVTRRDFTINAIAFDAINKRLIDLTGGMKDLSSGIIRTIGEPLERFSEDGLRPIRACRFAAQLKFKIEKKTFDAIPKALDIVGMVSKERVRDELKKIMMTEKPSVGIELLRESGILKLFLPELLEGYGVIQNKFHKHDVYYHNLYTCDAALADNINVRFAALFHDLAKPACRNPELSGGDTTFYNHEVVSSGMARHIMRRLKFSNEESGVIIKLIRLHMFHYTNEWTDGAVRRFIRKAGLELLPELFSLRYADRIGNGLKSGRSNSLERLKSRIEKVIEEQNAISLKDLAVNGRDIMELKNIGPGPEVGMILNNLLEYILDNPDKNTRESLLEYAKGNG